jgi:hypothetical protein
MGTGARGCTPILVQARDRVAHEHSALWPPAPLSRASTPFARRASSAPCDRRRPVMRGLAGRRAGLVKLSRQHVQPLAQRVGPRTEEHPLNALICCPCPLRSNMLPRRGHNGWARMALQLRNDRCRRPPLHCRGDGPGRHTLGRQRPSWSILRTLRADGRRKTIHLRVPRSACL